MSRRTRSVAVAVNACMLTPGQVSRRLRQLPIFGPEVVTPLADTVGFIDRDKAQRPASQQPPKAVASLPHQPFGRDIQQPVLPVTNA